MPSRADVRKVNVLWSRFSMPATELISVLSLFLRNNFSDSADPFNKRSRGQLIVNIQTIRMVGGGHSCTLRDPKLLQFPFL